MEVTVHKQRLSLNWEVINLLSRLDRFDASWSTLERTEGQTLKQLKTMATVRSVGASTRIEGSKMTDEEVAQLLGQIATSKLEDRDAQEVVGYFDALDLISEAHDTMSMTANTIKNLHNVLMKHSQRDQWHKGEYKQLSNVVQAQFPDGTTRVIFETTPPGFATEDAMNSLMDWYTTDTETHPLVKAALLSYEFVSIHPFQDGNGRLSRLLARLALLQSGYKWIEYVSLEHEIEARKTEYYQVLRTCQAQRPNENVNAWILFFFRALAKVQDLLMQKLEESGRAKSLAPREKAMLAYIGNHPGCKSGEIAEQLGIPNPTVKRLLAQLVQEQLLVRHGRGPGTNYTIG